MKNDHELTSSEKGQFAVVKILLLVIGLSMLPFLISSISSMLTSIKFGIFNFEDIKGLTETMAATAIATWIGAFLAFRWESNHKTHMSSVQIKKELKWVAYLHHAHLKVIYILQNQYHLPSDGESKQIKFSITKDMKSAYPEISYWSEESFKDYAIEIADVLSEASFLQKRLQAALENVEHLELIFLSLPIEDYFKLVETSNDGVWQGDIDTLTNLIGSERAMDIYSKAKGASNIVEGLSDDYQRAVNNLIDSLKKELPSKVWRQA